MKKPGVPLVPGTEGAVADLQEAWRWRGRSAFPSDQGRSRRWRQGHAHREEESGLKKAWNAPSAKQERLWRWHVFIEKYVAGQGTSRCRCWPTCTGIRYMWVRARMQIQRRHQKVRGGPKRCAHPAMRKKMGEAAVSVAKSVQYVGAGTVEFLFDANGEFYFMEMNTRLQVEHPVTEMISGLDLVKEQIKVAQGEELSFKQEDLKIHGHAIEVRVYAEDPANNFLPDIGTLTTYRTPQGAGYA